MKYSNKRLYDTNSIQHRLLPILAAFDKVCKEHNLTYYIWAGTQLGAVRHGGFIPWDDDADLAMPRADYEILMRNAKEWMGEPFAIANHRVTEKYPHYFARVQDTNTTMVIRKHLGYVEGVHVDIFPLDNIPNNKVLRHIHFTILSFLHRLLYLASRSPNKDKKVYKHIYYWLIQTVCKRSMMLRIIDKFIQRCNKKDTINCTDSFYGSRKFVAHSTIGKPVRCNFAGVELLGVENYDKYLSEKYGDYMTPPSEGNRVQHSVDFIDLAKPFSKFDIKSLRG